MAFDRWSCWFDRTWAYQIFRRHQTELNNFYWSSAVSAKFSDRHARSAPAGASTATHFALTNPDHHRYPPTVGEWRGVHKEQQNWARLSTAMALCSYLEIYMRAVCSLAIESDPGLLHRAYGSVDGVSILKNSPGYAFPQETEGLAKGTWPQRISSYKGLFGSVPTKLAASVSELDKLRVYRNGVGHAFGRDTKDFSSSITIASKPLLRLSETRLKKWLGISQQVALSIDNHLRGAHIGAYEILRFVHERPAKRGWGVRDYARSLKQEIGAAHLGSLPGLAYIQGAIRHYQSA